jgi:hypothetical protein
MEVDSRDQNEGAGGNIGSVGTGAEKDKDAMPQIIWAST